MTARAISTCDQCLAEDVPCTVYEEGVFCNHCVRVAREEESADAGPVTIALAHVFPAMVFAAVALIAVIVVVEALTR